LGIIFSYADLETTSMTKSRYAFAVEGNSSFLRAAAESQAEVIEPFFETPDWEYAPRYFESLPAFAQKRAPTALGGLEVFGVFIIFTASCFGKKIFDEIYERTLKRPVAAQLDIFFSKVTVPAGKVIEYRDIVYFEDMDLAIVVRAMVDREKIAEIQPQLMLAHDVARAFVERRGRLAAIHCHTLMDGNVSIEPKLFSSLHEMNRHDRSQAAHQSINS
jgi:hypothetical protein